jgi:hypothetical protein
MPTRPTTKKTNSCHKQKKPIVTLLSCRSRCDQCELDAVVTCNPTGEKYCEYHSPVDVVLPQKSLRDEHAKAVKLMTSLRYEMGLCGVVTSGPLPAKGSRVPLPRIDGAVTVVLQGACSSEKNGIRRMPELNSVNMGPVVLFDGITVWSHVLSNGMHSLRWYEGVQTIEESDAMGSLMRKDRAAYSHKTRYPGFPEAAASLRRSFVRIAPLLDAVQDDMVLFDEAMSELAWYGALLSRIETRALFCSLYARLAEPKLQSLRRRMLEGVSFHVAGGFTFTEDATTHFRDVTGCVFQEESCVVCILQGLVPWDDYIQERIAAVDACVDHHPVFAGLIRLFFGERYKQPLNI